MRNKLFILDIVLVILLTSSIIGNYTLFNRSSNLKQTLASIQDHLRESKVKLQDAQAEQKVLKESLEDMAKQAPLVQAPSAPNKKLPNGMTLQEVKLKVDQEESLLKSKGFAQTDIDKILTQMCKDVGTTIEEVKQVQTAPVQTVKPSTSSGTTTTQQGSTQVSGSTTPDSEKSSLTKSAEAKFNENNAKAVGGTTVRDPNFNLHTP